MFGVFEIMAFENVAGNSFKHHENACVSQSTCYQTVLRYQM